MKDKRRNNVLRETFKGVYNILLCNINCRAERN